MCRPALAMAGASPRRRGHNPRPGPSSRARGKRQPTREMTAGQSPLLIHEKGGRGRRYSSARNPPPTWRSRGQGRGKVVVVQISKQTKPDFSQEGEGVASTSTSTKRSFPPSFADIRCVHKSHNASGRTLNPAGVRNEWVEELRRGREGRENDM